MYNGDLSQHINYMYMYEDVKVKFSVILVLYMHISS